jgi:hypothetical protein
VAYGVAGAGLARALLVLASSRKERPWRGTSPAPALVVVGAAADLAETLLFRASLAQVLATEDPGALPSGTRLFTVLKMGALLAAPLLITRTAFRARRASAAPRS